MGLLVKMYQRFWSALKKLPPLSQMREFLDISHRNLQVMEEIHVLSRKIADFNETQAAFNNVALQILIDGYLSEHIFANPKYADTKRLNRYEYQVYSQSGEDGILTEIFNRIGITDRFFVEFGVGNGLENNTTYLLIKGWNGLWIDANTQSIGYINEKFRSIIDAGRLVAKESFITAENIEEIFRQTNVPREFDVLSIDIDGNDYWVWEAIKNYQPRVVVIEYNALFPPDTPWVMAYQPLKRWGEDSYFGASLKSLETLGLYKGYRLVGCNLTGVNAFFVRSDLIDGKFCESYTAEAHYEPPRYYLIKTAGYRRTFGGFESR